MLEPADYADRLDTFLARIRTRLEDGHREYQGRGFAYSTERLLREEQEETEDVPGYIFLRWATLEARRERIEWLERVAAQSLQVVSQLVPEQAFGGRMLGLAAFEELAELHRCEPGRAQKGTSPKSSAPVDEAARSA